MDEAYQQKQQKEQQAQDLLNSIDTYLLQELGIQLPEAQPNTIQGRMFSTSWKKATQNRLDPFYNSSKFELIKTSVTKSILKTVPLKQITKAGLIKGYLPNSEEKDGSNKVVQINSINEDGFFDLSNVITAKDVFTKHQKLQKDDILVVITGATIGKIGLWQEEGDYYLGGDIVKFQTNSVNPYYVYNYLRSRPVQTEIKRHITGATNGHLSPHDINRILIPIPVLDKEFDLIEKISIEIITRREKAFLLKKEAQASFIQTKKEIEQLILA